MNDQYIQWLSGPMRGEIESAQLVHNGQTSKDVIVLSGGRELQTTQMTIDFILLPSSDAALNSVELDMMYPVPSQKKNRLPRNRDDSDMDSKNVEHMSIMGLDLDTQEEDQHRATNRSPQHRKNTFASDLLSRAKKVKTNVTLSLDIDIPSHSFFSMISETFDDDTIKDIMRIIVTSVDKSDLQAAIEMGIKKIYEEKR